MEAVQTVQIAVTQNVIRLAFRAKTLNVNTLFTVSPRDVRMHVFHSIYCTNLQLRAKECLHAAVNRHYVPKLLGTYDGVYLCLQVLCRLEVVHCYIEGSEIQNIYVVQQDTQCGLNE